MHIMMTGQQLTMSSREIAELVDSRHSDVMRSIERLMEKGIIGGYAATAYTNPQNGVKYPEYLIGKRDTYVIVAQMSPEFTATLVDRWQELESNHETSVVKLPDFTNPAEAARSWAIEFEEKQEAQKALAIAAPKAAFVDSYVQAKTGSMGIREVCKVLRAKEPEFVDFLLECGFMYRTAKGAPLLPKSDHIHNGRFEAKTGVSQRNEHAYIHYKFTSKGMQWIAGEWGKYNVRELF